MKLTINGKLREVDEVGSLLDLLQHLGVKPELVAVEHNAEIVRRERLGDIALRDGDQLEIIHMVGGGA